MKELSEGVPFDSSFSCTIIAFLDMNNNGIMAIPTGYRCVFAFFQNVQVLLMIGDTMDKELIKTILMKNGFEVILDERYRNCGYRIKISDGTAVFCYDRGTYYCQGKEAEKIKQLLVDNNVGEVLYNNNVFVVYGHDLESKNEIIRILREWKLNPLLIDQLPVEGRTIIEQLEHYIPKVNYGIVLATPDDIGREKHSIKENYRARQNVIFEMGMLFSKLGRNRVCILYKNIDGFEKPSDIDGLLYLPFEKIVSEVREKLARELKAQG